ncbi:9189_t:CDS:1, partial [Racocetra fulgida]
VVTAVAINVVINISTVIIPEKYDLSFEGSHASKTACNCSQEKRLIK